MIDPCLNGLHSHLGLDEIPGAQEIWRFLDMMKAKDLFKTSELYLRQVSMLRFEDLEESRLPSVIQRTVANGPMSAAVKKSFAEMCQICESQADGLYASCWFIPGSAEQEERMWRKYGGGSSGGICIVSTIKLLVESLPSADFELGKIRYIHPEISFLEAFRLNQYRSMPFSLNSQNMKMIKRFACSNATEVFQEKVSKQSARWTSALPFEC
jgi:hypothetical protein